jgi:hypothetical protein
MDKIPNEIDLKEVQLYEVISILHEVVVRERPRRCRNQVDFVNMIDEREEQIIFEIRKRVHSKEHADNAVEFVKKMLRATYLPL